jgi:hypothetical protein
VASTSKGRRRREGGGTNMRSAGFERKLPLRRNDSVGGGLGSEERGEGTFEHMLRRSEEL